MHVGRKSLTVRFAVIGGVLAIFTFGCNDSADRDAETIGITVPPVVASTIDNEISTVDTTAMKSGENLDDGIESSYQTTTSTTIHPANSSTPEQNSPTSPTSTTERQSRESEDNDESDNYNSEPDDIFEQNNEIMSSNLIDDLTCAYSEKKVAGPYPWDISGLVYHISGYINMSEGGRWGEWDKANSVDFDPVFVTEKNAFKDDFNEDPKLRLELRDSEGNLLRNVPVESFPPSDADQWQSNESNGPYYFYTELLNMPWENDISNKYHTIGLVDISQSDSPRLIDSISRSNNMPTASIVHPTFGQTITGNKLTLSWSANDLDGDRLAYRVWYSRHNGRYETYQNLGKIFDSTSLEFNRLDNHFAQFESHGAKFGVSVSDGAQSIFIESDTFCVPRIVPLYREINIDAIDTQHLGIAYNNQTVVLGVTAYSMMQAQEFKSLLFDWHSDRDGFLGRSTYLLLSPRELTDGLHTITATGARVDDKEIIVSATIGLNSLDSIDGSESTEIQPNVTIANADNKIITSSLFDKLACANSQDEAEKSQVDSMNRQFYFILGNINVSENGRWRKWDEAIGAEIESIFVAEKVNLRGGRVEDEDLYLELRDVEGELLKTAAVQTLASPLGDEGGPYHFWSEFIVESQDIDIFNLYRTIVLVDNSQPDSPRIIDLISRSDNMPILEIINPTFDQVIGDEPLILSWKASDLDGEELKYRTWYSTNAGNAYRPVEYSLDSTLPRYYFRLPDNLGYEFNRLRSYHSLSGDFGDFRQFESHIARFAVSVSDGTQSVFLESDIFCVPHITVSHRELNIDASELPHLGIVPQGQSIVLSVTANSAMRKEISSLVYDWHSRHDGFLGRGTSIMLAPSDVISSGTHIIIATGRTSSGEEITASGEITIGNYSW